MANSAGRVVFIGAAGEMCRLAIERFAVADGEGELALYDIRPELLEPLVTRLPAGRATAKRLDLYDREGLRKAIEGAALVVLGAGPYIRTSAPVIEACLAAKVPYLDFDDDVESTEHALSLHEKAKAAGIPIYVGCGASPGRERARHRREHRRVLGRRPAAIPRRSASAASAGSIRRRSTA